MGIVLDDVTKRFGDEVAVESVSFTLEQGDFFAIVGPSGCGKSTLLRLIAGLEAPSEGRISLNGQEVAGPDIFVAPEDRATGFVFQSYALWPHMTVLGNVAFPDEARGATKADAERAARAHLETVALANLADRRPEALSGGQRQRVALARCLAGGARTILMDEPLANLDPHLRAAMERELLEFHRSSGTTTVYITHDQREAMALADRMAVMQNGRFLQVGRPDEIFDRPDTVDVARFIGQGAIQPARLRDGRAVLGEVSVPVRAKDDHGDGPAQILFRPRDVRLAQGGETTLPGVVSGSYYRGGAWEAQVKVNGLPEPFEISDRAPLSPGQAVGLELTGGWVIPD